MSNAEKLTAFITATDNDVEVLRSEIAEFDALMQQKDGELAKATRIREAENAEHVPQQTDLAEFS